MKDPVQTLKGFRDFLGDEARKRQWLIENIRAVFERYGFEPLETPALEYESLLLGKYGAEADKLIYGFEDKGKRRVALRYDQTIPTARIVAQYQNQLVLPYKRYQIQPVWRADKPQKGRYREFFQCDADIIGTTSVNADAEILAVYASIYLQIGLTSIKIKVNDRQALITSIKNSGIGENQIFSVIQTIDKLDKKTEVEVLEELVQKGIQEERAQSILNNLKNSSMPESLTQIISATVDMGIDKNIFEYTPTLARGLDYYTGLIFEGIIPEYEVGSVGGGGRYDNLLKSLVEVDMPAVGFGLGFDRTLEAAETLGKIPSFSDEISVLVTIFSPELKQASYAFAQKLRQNNICTEVFLEENKGIEKQLKYANKKNIKYVAIIGPEEAEKNSIKIKNMKTGEQKETTIEEIVKLLND